MQGLGIFSDDAERAVLGSVIQDDKCFDVVKEYIIESDAFYVEKNKKIWETIVELKSENIPVDTVNISSKLKGITYYLTGLEVPTTANVESYAKQVHSDWLRRKLVLQSQEIANKASDDTNDISTLRVIVTGKQNELV